MRFIRALLHKEIKTEYSFLFKRIKIIPHNAPALKGYWVRFGREGRVGFLNAQSENRLSVFADRKSFVGRYFKWWFHQKTSQVQSF